MYNNNNGNIFGYDYEQSANSTNIDNLNTALTSLQNDFNAQITNLGSSIAVLASHFGNNNQLKIANLEDVPQSKIISLLTDLASINASISTLNNSLSSLNTSLQNQINGNASNISTLQSQMTTASANITSNFNAISTAYTNITTLQNNSPLSKFITALHNSNNLANYYLDNQGNWTQIVFSYLFSNFSTDKLLLNQITTGSNYYVLCMNSSGALNYQLLSDNNLASISEAKITNLTSDLSTINSNISTNASNISSLQTTVSGHTTSLSTLNGYFNSSDKNFLLHDGTNSNTTNFIPSFVDAVNTSQQTMLIQQSNCNLSPYIKLMCKSNCYDLFYNDSNNNSGTYNSFWWKHYIGGSTVTVLNLQCNGSTSFLWQLGWSGYRQDFYFVQPSDITNLRAIKNNSSTYTHTNANEYITYYQFNASALSPISTLNSQMTTANSNISTLNTQMTTANSNISTLTTQMSSANSSISTLTTQMSSANSSISTLNTQMTTANSTISTNEMQMNIAINNIGTLSTQMQTATDIFGVLTTQMTLILQTYFINGVINASSLPPNLASMAGIGFNNGCLLKSTASGVEWTSDILYSPIKENQAFYKKANGAVVYLRNGPVYSDNFYICNNTSNSSGIGLGDYSALIAGVNGTIICEFRNSIAASTPAALIDATGAYQINSQRKNKENIIQLADVNIDFVKLLSKITINNFNFKNSENKTNGVVIEEVLDVIKDYTAENKAEEANLLHDCIIHYNCTNKSLDCTCEKYFSYPSLHNIHLHTTQQLIKIINEMKVQIADLYVQINELKNK